MPPPEQASDDQNVNSPVAATPAQAEERSITVPPFGIAGHSGRDSRLLADGIRHELLMQLAQVPGLTVIEDSTEGRQEINRIPEAGNVLGVQITQHGDRLSIDAQLVDTPSERPFWSRSYVLGMSADKLFSIRTEIAIEGAQALGSSMSRAEPTPLSTNTLHALALTYGKLGRFEYARSVYARIRGKNPDSPLGYYGAGDTYLDQGQLDQATLWISRGQAVDPNDYDLAARVLSLLDDLGHHDGARTWSSWLDQWITKQPLPLAMQAKHHYLNGNFELALQYANLAINLDLDNQGNSEVLFMRLKRDEAIANGDPAPGIALFLDRYPGLRARPPVLSPDKLQQAVHLASLFSLNSEKQRAAVLLEAAIETYDEPFTIAGSGNAHLTPVKAEALALLGRRDAALAELRRIIDRGWRVDWLWSTDLNASFNGIRDTAEFRAMVQELAIDVAAQRIAVEDMEAEGKIGRPVEPVSNPELEALRNYTK